MKASNTSNEEQIKNNSNKLPVTVFNMKENEFWLRAPIVVGGTGGSGTRGVVDVLMKLGVYMVKVIKFKHNVHVLISCFFFFFYNFKPLILFCFYNNLLASWNEHTFV